MEKLKNYLINQDILSIKKSFKIKVFDYFHYMLDGKTTTSFVTLYILHSIELIQLISFAFSTPFTIVWKLSEKINKNLRNILEAFRLAPLFSNVSILAATIISAVLLFIIISYFILLMMQITLRKENSHFFEKLMSFTKLTMPIITIALFIPLNELFLTTFNCKDNHINFLNDEIKCWKAEHVIMTLLSFVGIFSNFFVVILLTFFYFYPFVTAKATIKLTSSFDMILLLIKFIFVVQKIYIKTEYISIAILLILSLFLVYYQDKEPIYNNKKLELFLVLRNIILVWTYFTLLIAKICYNTNVKTMIYLLISGYPIIIFTSIMYINEKNNKFNFNQASINNVNICLTQIRLLMKLIDSFFNEKKSNISGNNSDDKNNKKNDLLLKGIIKMHTLTCLKEDCPLTKFIKNKGNYNIQKQCLLNYMAIFFKNSIKKFPNSILLRMQFIQFNYDKKYNLNNIKTTLEEIKKLKFGLSSEFILYCQEKELSKIRRDVNDGNDAEKEKLVLDQNYKKLKNLIVNSTKLYVEFWGIFAANITNNLNTQKLYKLGEKLNAYLKEIKHLWDKNLKNRKIDIDNENNAQLFSRFLREILWDQKRSEDVQQKINEEHNMQSYNRVVDEDKNQLDNLDNLETQDYLLFVNVFDKGKTSILQYSTNLTDLIGYQKSELINKPIETLMPSLLAIGNSQKIENYIKEYSSEKNGEKDSFQCSENSKQFTLIKNKMGYLIPFNVRYTLYDNNDFSNNYLIKAKYESRDVKSMYAYYLLTKPDFSLESISSSSIHLGLSMDLLKKYVIKLNILIRTNNDENLNLYDKYKEFRDEAGKITWVEPDLIYPKNDLSELKDVSIPDLIQKSKKTKMYLQIYEMKNGDEIIAFIFKLYEKKNTQNQKQSEINRFIPGLKNQILFDLLTLRYIRAKIVKEKSGFRNLRGMDEDKDDQNDKTLIKSGENRKNTQDSFIQEDLSEEEKKEIAITKDKILDLQTKDSNGIKSFINILPFFGNEISLIKHRPNKEQYPAGKAQEPQIKIDVSKYTKLIESKLRENPKLYKKIKNIQKGQKLNKDEENLEIKQDFINEEIKEEEDKNVGIGNININRDLTANGNVSLINVINISSIHTIKIIDFFIYFFVITIITVHFILTYNYFQKNSKIHSYFVYSYQLLDDIVYIKYIVSEGIYLNEIDDYLYYKYVNKTDYINIVKYIISSYSDDVTKILYEFNNPKVKFPKEYTDYISNTNLTIKTNNELTKTEQQPYSSAISKLTTALFYVSSSNNNDFNMQNNYAYELMVNLMDSYYITFEAIILKMLNFLNSQAKSIQVVNIIIFFISFFISVSYLILFYGMLVKLDKDREKPLNLFLTIKNRIFEGLKNSSENFSNKLLNKFFRVDENEEESQQNYSKMIIKSNDINIAKFKALNEYKSLNKKENSFMKYFVQLIIFYGIIDIIIFLVYLNSIFFNNNIDDYITIYNSTIISEIYLVTRINIIKQYFYNESITNYGFTEDKVKYNYLYAFLFMGQEVEKTLKETSKTNSFLKDEYKKLFRRYYYNNISKIINDYYKINNTELSASLVDYLDNGYNSVNFKIFEILKYLTIKYFFDPQRNLEKNISALINHLDWFDVHTILLGIVRPWYQSMNDLMCSYYNSYTGEKQTYYIFLYAILVILISLYYWIAWKHYEDQFIDSIQKSFDLINLIPEEIKNIIINKLNEN